ncbi:DUF2156 domain-containing protein [Streptosporangiaceae bacterium NEAU-GS5]|nr:DUF2156 domain-containing protein [Streptosporangiaceae bacterium NEAU-GS5]
MISQEAVLDAVRAYGDNPSGFLAVNSGNSYFAHPGEPGVIVFRSSGRYLVQFGGPFAPPPAREALLRAFLEHAHDLGKQLVCVQLQRQDAEFYTEHGFAVNQIGASYAIDLTGYTLQGTRFMRLRNKISRARRCGLTVAEADPAEHTSALAEIDQAWLGSKGENTKELEFLVGQTGGPMQRHRRLFLGLVNGRAVAYISYSPVYGARPGWMHDLSRRLPGHTGAMEAVNAFAIQAFQSEGVPWLHLGFTPFTGLADEHEVPGASRAYAWFMRWLWENGDFVYPARSQLAYKHKWAPDVVLPEYIAFHKRTQAAGLIHVFKVANAF